MSDKPNVHTGGEMKSFHEELEDIRRSMDENLRYTKSVYEFTPKRSKDFDSEIQQTLSDLLKYTKASYALLIRINRWVVFARIMGIIKFILIVVPIALGIIYLPPFINEVVAPFMKTIREIQGLR